MSNQESKSSHPYYRNTTENMAIANVTREEKRKKNEWEQTTAKLLIKDLKAVLKRARELEFSSVNLYRIPIENIELILAALKKFGGKS